MSSEEELLRAWTPANLEAFGAALRAQGHPRGELIALDFVLERERSVRVRAALVEEKQGYQVEWLGAHSEDITTRFGFVEDVRAETADMPHVIELVAPFARSLWLWGDPEDAAELVDRVAAAPRPFLHKLRITSYHRDNQTLVIDDARARRLIDATPNLRCLHATGHRVLDDIPHPGVEVLRTEGFDAIGALLGRGVMPNVRTLDFAMHIDSMFGREPPPEALRAGLVPRAAFPNLAVFDVSRNEPREHTHEPNCLSGATSLYDVLELFAILPHVVELRVPSVRTVAQARQLLHVVEGMPALRRAEIVRVYGSPHIPPKHARIAVPAPVSWPAASELRNYDALMFQTGDEWVRLDLARAYELVELHHEALPANERAAWDALWDCVRTLGTADDQRIAMFPRYHVHALCTAMANVDLEWFDSFGKRFIEHAPDVVAVRRIDGFESSREDKPPGPREVATSERIDEHERALQEHWDLDRVAVYADELQQHGDLRGNLIAIDLEYLRNRDIELTIQHDELHEKIFGEATTIRSDLGLAIVDMSSYGNDGTVASKVVGDVARYLSELELFGEIGWMNEALAHVTAERRPWLRTVRLDVGLGEPRERRWSEQLATAAPHLEVFELELDEPAQTLAGFQHPRVRRMKITGVHGFEVLGTAWPALEELDFAFGREDDSYPADTSTLFVHAKTPALHVLDFSRNEPPGASYESQDRHQCRIAFFPALAWIEGALAAQLTKLRLPSPRAPDDVVAIQRLLDRAPALQTVEIVRRYPRGPAVDLQHPSATLVVPTPVPWPPFDRLVARSALAVDKIIVPLSEAVPAMEKWYERLSEPGRRAWAELWALAEDPLRAQFTLPAETLYRAADALAGVRRYRKEWVKELMAHLHPLALARKTVTVRRAAAP